MIDRIFSVVVALVLASLIWLYASSREQEMLDNVPVPVHITLVPSQADQYSIEVTGPSQVPVSFTGPPSRIREVRGLFQRGELKMALRVAVPEDRQNEPRYLDTVRIDPSDLHIPPGVHAVIIEGRNRIPVTLRRMVERRLPLRFDAGSDERISKVLAEPATVLVRGPQETLEHQRSIATLPFALPPQPEGTTAQTMTVGPVALVDQIEGQPIQTTPREVTLRVTLQPSRQQYELDVPINFLCPSNFPRRPRFRNERDGRLTLQLTGPAGGETPKVFAFIDLTTAGKFTAGNASPYYDEPVQVQLPPGFQLAEPLPRFVAFELAPGEIAVSSPGGAPSQ